MNLDGPHRVFAVVAGLWTLRAVVLLDRWGRCAELRQWKPLDFDWACNSMWGSGWSTATHVAVPIACLYVVAFVIGPPLVRWIREGFSSRELG